MDNNALRNKILFELSEMKIPGFFIVADFSTYDTEMPRTLEGFIHEKIKHIQNGNTSRKFVFQENKWRIILTFYDTNKIVEERYALKNKFIKQRSNK